MTPNFKRILIIFCRNKPKNTQILQSFVRKTIITEKEQEVFLQSIDSISSQIKRDFSRLNKIEFLKKYGHLRPGTYDILSARYDETPERYFDWDTRINSRTSKKNSEFSFFSLKN